MTRRRQALGRRGEATARDLLESLGYGILETNYRIPAGEIDLVARDGETLCFVEVKTRKDDGESVPEEGVTPRKQQQIRRVAALFLQERDLGEAPCRFDVVSVVTGPSGEVVDSRLIRDAFQ